MKEIKKEISVTMNSSVFVSNDGKEFCNSYECRKYEVNKALNILMEKVKYIEEAQDMHNLATDYISQESSYYWFNVQTDEDIKLFKDLLDEDVKKGIISVEVSSECSIFIERLDDMVNTINAYLKVFGYEEVKKK